jgi:hypothetical protein
LGAKQSEGKLIGSKHPGGQVDRRQTVGEEIDMGQSHQRAGKSKWKQSNIRMEARNRIKANKEA